MIHIELRSNQPIYEQIISQIKEQLVMGNLEPGDAMPSIRKLSVMTQTNPNTVARAYQELERMGIIETLIGRGTFICQSPEQKPDGQTLERIRAQLRPALTELKLMGLSSDDIAREISGILKNLEGEHR